jgi:hypothetical protein
MASTSKVRPWQIGLANLFACLGAFEIFVIYLSFVSWGADGFVYWSEVALIGVSVLALSHVPLQHGGSSAQILLPQ